MHLATSLIVVTLAGCRIGEHIAPPPVDASEDGTLDAALVDALPDAAPPGGMHAVIGERPEWSGSCDALDDRVEMLDRFDPPTQEMDVEAGWEFDTDADSYGDPSYNFAPAWPTAESGRFSVRFSASMRLEAGPHCFSIDIGATGTDILGGKNACGQVWLGDGAAALAETGFGAASVDAATACVDIPSAGLHDLDVVYWYFNILERAKLAVRWCAGAGCTPDRPLATANVFPRPRSP